MEAMGHFSGTRSDDEELVAISENDACSVDALQVLLGTTAGKGNLAINNIGKNVYTVYSRKAGIGLRFSRKSAYTFTGEDPQRFEALEKKFTEGTATPAEKREQKIMKAVDLLSKPVEEVFAITPAAIPKPAFAELAPSVACALCGELTMKTKMVAKKGALLCQPCATQAP